MKKNGLALMALTIMLAALLSDQGYAWLMSQHPGAAIAACSAGQNAELLELNGKISKAGSLDEARSLALEPTDSALEAVQNARTMVPFSDDLGRAESRLQGARSRIEAAGTQQQVADEFSGMMLALGDEHAARVKVGKVGCDYSTGELIAIVLGLILGIIPGLILMVLLC